MRVPLLQDFDGEAQFTAEPIHFGTGALNFAKPVKRCFCAARFKFLDHAVEAFGQVFAGGS
ncbi:MAG: hypothetical protein NTZ98_03415 [Acidobacteria bacterium]|nr:hypothetical protein [Acidobacteriota bacterium]